MTTPNLPALLPVIDIDRVAATSVIDFEGVFETTEWDGVVYAKSDILRGDGDDHPTVQAFARHRLQSTPAEPKTGWPYDGSTLADNLHAEPKVSRDVLRPIIDRLRDMDADTLAYVRLLPETRELLAALSNPPADGVALRVAAINAALCLSGFAGEGIDIEGFQAPEDAYGAITVALGIPDADDDDLRNALRALAPPSAPLGAGGEG